VASSMLFSAMVGKPYPVLLINMLLATLDRFIYTKWLGQRGSCKCMFVDVTQNICRPNLKFDSHQNNANYANFILHIHAYFVDFSDF